MKDWGGGTYDRPRYWEDERFNGPNQPVVGVTWYEAAAYCRWLTATADDGCLYRLPTEAEWERAARGPHPDRPPAVGPLPRSQGRGATGASPLMGGNAIPMARGGEKGRYPWGDEWQPGRANTIELGLERTTPVGIFADGASPEGLLDMAGNVWEWCRDGYSVETYRRRAGRVERDPAGPGEGQYRVLRGGSWYHDASIARCGFRGRDYPDDRFDYRGFRVARGSHL